MLAYCLAALSLIIIFIFYCNHYFEELFILCLLYILFYIIYYIILLFLLVFFYNLYTYYMDKQTQII